MKAFINSSAYVPLYPIAADTARKLCDLPGGTVVDCIETQGIWSAVLYQTNVKTRHGFVRAEYVEEWIEPERHDVIRIRNATPNESDFAQNLVYLGNVQFNLCGEFSVLYCAGWDEFDIEAWLDEWKIKQPSVFKRIFRLGKSVPVGIPDLINMLHSFEGYPDQFMTLTDLFRFRGSMLFTPGRVQSALQSHRLIIGCKIESQFGRLAQSGIAHWAVLESVAPEGRGGLVKLFNPASNGDETYTWEQVRASCTGNPFGLAVVR